MALLALFCRVELRLPNFVVATLTRASVLTALERGISARQITHVLRQRVHPVVAARDLGVPENVVDQLVIWQEERTRSTYMPALLISGFETAQQFRECAAHARALGCLEWADEAALAIVVEKGAKARMAAFMREKGMGRK